jgi:FtsP/CotA-like multicopper oxidase with cupredoxin domain
MQPTSRRNFLGLTGLLTAGAFVSRLPAQASSRVTKEPTSPVADEKKADYTLTIATTPIEIAHGKFISLTTYNGQFPGPLLRFKEGQRVIVDVHNETDVPEVVHWHGQMIPSDVDGAVEEGTPFVAPHGSRRIEFTPGPSGFRFYHTHVRAGANLSLGQYGGLVGPVYIEPRANPGAYDREIFLTLKEFEPTFSQGGDMDMNFLAPATPVPSLKERGESEMMASPGKGNPKGFEVGYESFTINGRKLGHGEPVRVKRGQRVLFHVLNGSAGEIRSLALPGHQFNIVAMDGNLLPSPVTVPVLWIGTAERISAWVEMNQPGVWVMGDLMDDDRKHGMGIVVEYALAQGKPQWTPPKPYHWNYAHFGHAAGPIPAPDEMIDLLFEKDNAALQGFNRWKINGVSYPTEQMMSAPMFHLKEGRRYRLRMRNASDDIHPIHLHRHSFELTRVAGQPAAGVIKDVVMVGGYQEMEVDFVANNPGLTLFHCHQQLHMDFGFMALFDYV